MNGCATSVRLEQALDLDRGEFRAAQPTMHDLDGAKAALLAAELDVRRVDVGAQSIAAEAAVLVGLDDEEAARALDLHLDLHVRERAEAFDVLRLAEIGRAVLVDVGGLEVGLARPRRWHEQQGGQETQGPETTMRFARHRHGPSPTINAGRSCATDRRKQS